MEIRTSRGPASSSIEWIVRRRWLIVVLSLLLLYLFSNRTATSSSSSSSSRKDELTFTISPTHNFALANSQNQIGLVVDVITPIVQKEERKPLNLAIVLDTSGSMMGEKLLNAKAAISNVLSSLQPQDVVHFITYSTSAQTIFQHERSSNHHNLMSKINEIRADGSTNMWSGLELALEVLTSSSSSSSSNAMLLFSDGQVNSGLYVSTSALREKVKSAIAANGHCSLSALGVGDDFNEELMRALADEGKGAYYYIRNAQDLSRFVEGALRTYLFPFAYDAMLEIHIPSSSSSFSSSPRVEVIGHSDPTAIRLGDLVAGNTQTIIADLTFTPSVGAGVVQIATVSLSYRDLNGERIRITQKVNISVTPNAAEWENGINKASLAKVLVARTARRDEAIYNYLKNNNREEAMRESMILIEELQKVEEVAEEEENAKEELSDAGGYIREIRESLQQIKESGSSPHLMKQFQQRGYMKAKNSKEYKDLVMK